MTGEAVTQSCASADFRYPFTAKEGGGYSMPEFDADEAKGTQFPFGQVPVLVANGHRFGQARLHSPRRPLLRLQRVRVAAHGHV